MVIQPWKPSEQWPGCWLTDSLAGWLIDWLVAWIDKIVGWRSGCLTIWLADWLAYCDWLSGWLADLLTDSLAGWLTDSLACWLADLTANWLTALIVGWLTEWLADWLTRIVAAAVRPDNWMKGVRYHSAGLAVQDFFFPSSVRIIAFAVISLLCSTFYFLESAKERLVCKVDGRLLRTIPSLSFQSSLRLVWRWSSLGLWKIGWVTLYRCASDQMEEKCRGMKKNGSRGTVKKIL